jgi:hypothetical protein
MDFKGQWLLNKYIVTLPEASRKVNNFERGSTVKHGVGAV